MSKEAMKLALEALEHPGNIYHVDCPRNTAITALREALADIGFPISEQPAQQEPVAVVSGYYGGQCVILPIDPARIFNSNTALYTSPPAQQRHISYVCPQCYWSLDEQPAKQHEPVALLNEIRAEPTEMIHKWRVIDIIQSSPPQGIYYTPPAQRKPLTVEEIGNLLPDDDTPMSLGEAFVKFARAIEAAHGIKGNT